MGLKSRAKGARTELFVTHELVAAGIPATKRSGMYIAGHDIDATVAGRRLRIEVKSRAEGFRELHSWLSGADCLVLKADRRPALCVIPLDLAVQLVKPPAPPTIGPSE
jgi:hypothetical protein